LTNLELTAVKTVTPLIICTAGWEGGGGDVGLGARRESVKACLWFQDVNIISAVRYAMLFNLPPPF